MKILVFRITFWRTAWRFCSLLRAPMPPLFPPYYIPANEDRLVQAKLHSCTATPLTQSVVTPLQPRGQEPPLRLRILSQEQARPQFGGKCPRRRQLNLQEEDLESPGCSSCKRLKEEVQSLRAQLSAYETQTGEFLI